MESKILIDVDYEGNPYIRIEYKHSDDVRDKLIFRLLMQDRGMNVNFCAVRTISVNHDTGAQTSFVELIKPEDVQRVLPELIELGKCMDSRTAKTAVG